MRIKPPPYPPGDLYAGFLTRVFAYLIDTFILAIPSAIIIFLITVNALSDAMNTFSGLMSPLSGNIMSPGSFNAGYSSLFSPLFGSLFWTMVEAGAIVLGIRWIYFAYLESSPGQATFGKRTLGLVVIDGEGNRISFARATGRWLGKLLSWATFGIGFYLIGFTVKKQGLHDLMADTFVVYKDRFGKSG